MQEQIIAPYQLDPAWLIAASSFLVDRAKPDCERIRLPAKEVPGGLLTFGRGPLLPPQDTGRLAKLRTISRQIRKPVVLPHENVFDLRRYNPGNWAHFLNNHLPVVFTVCSELQIDPSEALLILPADIPGYINKAALTLGFDTLVTDDALTGDGISHDVVPWMGIRAKRARAVDIPFVRAALDRIDAEPTDMALPARVFLSRRDTRALLNEAQVADWLAARSFITVYPEDFSPADQIRLFRQTEIMVAVHGAGLAPLLYTQYGGRLRQLVEILHAGHMTDVYRVMAHQVGCDWIGVRGRLKPEYIHPAYEFDQTFRAYSLDNFEVDLAALEEAFAIAGIT